MLKMRCFAALTLGLSGTTVADIVIVPGDAPTIQAGIDMAAGGDDIVVGPGTYVENIDFLGKAITLRSFFGPDVTTIDATTIGGSVVTCNTGEGPDTVLKGFTITGGPGTLIEFLPNVFRYVGGGMYIDTASPTVTNCRFTGNGLSQTGIGGGMYNSASSPTLTNCTFSGNSAIQGAGIFARTNSELSLTSCIVTGNNARTTGGGAWFSRNTAVTLVDCEISCNVADEKGGGIYTDFATDLTLINCWILDNVANGGSGTLGGGGVAHTGEGAPAGDFTMTNCLLSGNIAFHGAGALVSAVSGGSVSITGCVFTDNTAGDGNSGSGGGLRYTGDSLLLSNCSFIGNEAFRGGGLDKGSNAAVNECISDGNTAVQGGGLSVRLGATGPVTLSNLVIRGNTAARGGGMYSTQQAVPTLANCLFTGNTATSFGGGVYNTVDSFPAFINCTLSGNDAPAGGGVFNSQGSCQMTNSIVWGNSNGAILGDIALVNYSCIEGGFIGTQNISEDPLFVDPDGDDDIVGTEDDNLRLLAGSPCIDAANNVAVLEEITTDLDGNPRFVDDPDTPDCQQAPGECGDPPVVDMGAYELQLPCPWDLDGSGSVGIADLIRLLGIWGTAGPEGDFNEDGTVGVGDMLIMFANWGPCP